MKKYGFYSKQDYTKEIMSQMRCENLAQAERDFSIKKNLDMDTFLKLYEVVEI
jgi:hypothetical protein